MPKKSTLQNYLKKISRLNLTITLFLHIFLNINLKLFKLSNSHIITLILLKVQEQNLKSQIYNQQFYFISHLHCIEKLQHYLKSNVTSKFDTLFFFNATTTMWSKDKLKKKNKKHFTILQNQNQQILNASRNLRVKHSPRGQ